MAERINWSDIEVRQARALYLRTPFGKIHDRNPEIIALAARIGRSTGSVALKLANLAGIDDSLTQKGMANASKTDRRIWSEYLEAPEDFLSALDRATTYDFPPDLQPDRIGLRDGLDVTVQSTRRDGQSLFREAVLTAYRGKCALTGIDDQRLLTASHIVGWAEDKALRMNPSNGICLNALHDRAFDRHLITFDENWRIQIRRDLTTDTRAALLDGVDVALRMPERFRPDPNLMGRHRVEFERLA